MAFWWCNQSRQWDVERSASVVCSSEAENDTYRKTVGEVREGDIIAHYRSPFLVAFSRAVEDGRHYTQLPRLGADDYGAGWRFRTEYFDLNEPIHHDIFGPILIRFTVKHYPINRLGHVREGYVFPFTREGIDALLQPLKEQFPDWIRLRSGRSRDVAS